MKDNINQARRNMLKLGGIAVVMVPMAAIAAKNEPLRKAMKYQDTPNGDKKCSNCMQFVPGNPPTDLGGCKVFAGDTEIAPEGYCNAWVKKA